MQRAPASPYPRPETAPGQRTLSPVKAIALFLLPFTSLVEVQVVGTLYGLDILLGLTLLVMLAKRSTPRMLGLILWVLVMLLVWLTGAVLSDWWNSSPFSDWSRGISKIVFFAIAIMAVWLLTGGRSRELSIFMGGFGLAAIVGVWVNPSEFAQEDPWKFGVGGGLLYFAVFLVSIPAVRRAGGPYAPAIAAALIGVLSLFQNSRSLAGIAILAAAYSVFAIFVSKRPAMAKFVTPISFTLILVLGLLSVQLISTGYGMLAESGALGRAAQYKYQWQTAGGDISLLAGGRPEIAVSLEAIKDSPVLGHGSWAKDPYYTKLYFDKLNEMGLLTGRFENFGSEAYLIPSHSHFFGAWVDHGILGALFWLSMLILALRALYAVLKARMMPSAIVTLSAMAMMWSILFSPFGGNARFDTAMQICILLTAVRSLQFSGALVRRRPHFGVQQVA